MRDIERRIKAALPGNVVPPAQAGGGRTIASGQALMSAGAALGAATLVWPREPRHTAAPLQSTLADSDLQINERAVIHEDLPHRSALTRPGISAGYWDNPIIKAAMPLLLLVERVRGQAKSDDGSLRAQFVREAQHFQQSLLRQHYLADDVHHFVYLLFSYIDETLGDVNGRDSLNLTLLVEFYQDAWGGEKCFEHLQTYWSASEQKIEILAFYDLILSLGFSGKFHVIERGPVLLADLRHKLDTLLYTRNPTQTLAQVDPVSSGKRTRRMTPLRLFCGGALILLLCYGVASWYLHEASRSLRSAILAWTPPEPQRINIMTTLPQPLPGILSEGWLEVREDPRGWLLIFTSDGAFSTGQSVLSEEFQRKRNIERLGEALAPWPGDLEVIGHTDSQPFRSDTRGSNLRLSAARAETVAAKLREVMTRNQKYQRDISSVGKGDAEPLADNKTAEGRRKNRRVDILWKIGNRGEEEGSPDEAQRDRSVRELMDAIRNRHTSDSTGK